MGYSCSVCLLVCLKGNRRVDLREREGEGGGRDWERRREGELQSDVMCEQRIKVKSSRGVGSPLID